MKVIDMHCDTISVLKDSRYSNHKKELYENDLQIDILKMQKGDYLLQNFAMFTNLKKVKNLDEHMQRMLDTFYDEMDKNKEYIRPVTNVDEILENEKNGYMSAMLTIEESAVVHNDLAYLRNFYRMGVRMVTLTWNYKNGIGYPNFKRGKKNRGFHTYDDKNGLTKFGIEYIKECERLGIIIDVSHLNDAGFYDVLKYTTKPFVASHSNARSICDHARNLSDDMILKLKERNGVMGINFYHNFVDEKERISTIDNIVKHILYIKDLAGIDVIGLGSDFDGIDKKVELKDASYMQELKDALLKAGLTYEEVEKIFYKNVLRVYKEVLK